MIKKRYLVALGALSAALGACGSSIDAYESNGAGTAGTTGSPGGTGSGGSGPSGSGGTTSSGAGGTSGASNAGGTSGSGAASGSDGGGGAPTCVPGIPTTTQIPRMKMRQYDAVIKDLLDITALPTAPNVVPSSFLAEDSEGSMTGIAWNGYLNAGAAIAAEVLNGASRSKFISCDPSASGCFTETIKTFGRKAFRRPLTAAEVTSFERLIDLTPQGTPDQIAQAILYAFLVSPTFIMIPELAPDQEDGAFKLSQHELAARLSFLLWNSVPDAILSTAADAGQLATKEQLLEQARRMVQDRERTAPAVSAFHRVWADIRLGAHWDSIDHDTAKYPNWTPAVPAPMMAEIDAFFEDVAFEGGSFRDLFLSNVAFVNRDTAPIYGLDPASFGTDLTRVLLDQNQRPGFLTRVGFLASFSAGGSTSPILRGAYISTKVLGVHIDDPPEEAATTPIPMGKYETQREIVEAHTAGPKCAGCHAVAINPAGFVMERYDSIGAWQDVDPLGGAIEASAEVTFSDTNTKLIETPLALMTELGTGPDAQRRYAQQLVSFTTGRSKNDHDACVVDMLGTKLSQDGYSIVHVLADLTQADSFRLRTVGN
jgi:hypothetical protein